MNSSPSEPPKLITMESKPTVLKDIKNFNVNAQIQGIIRNTKAMVTPQSFTNMAEDKENVNPETGSSLVTKKIQVVEQKTEPQKLLTEELSDCSSDGFDVNESLELDEASLSEDDSQGLHTKFQNEDSSKKRESSAPSPLIMKGLLNNRVLFDIASEENEDNGASPSFPEPQSIRQERRKLDFNNLENTSPTTTNNPRKFRRCISMFESGPSPSLQLNKNKSSPEIAKMGQNNVDMTSPLSRPFSTLTKKFSSFKRPLTLPLGNSQVLNQQQQPQSKKLRRCESMNQTTHDSIPLTKSMSMSTLDSPQISTPFFGMSLNSESEASIKKACNLADDPNLTGDRSKTFSLPLIPEMAKCGSADAKTLPQIDCHTLADLINGKHNDKIASYRIIDARYCYEYQGGHIQSAENFGTWDEEAFMNEFLPENLAPRQTVQGKDVKPKILIFHCEFSSARGPTLMRFLRNRDRALHKQQFPALHYPECYLLSEGYKQFYANYPHLCDPNGYVQMADNKFIEEEKKFHKKSKSWAPGSTMSRAGSKSRLGKL